MQIQGGYAIFSYMFVLATMHTALAAAIVDKNPPTPGVALKPATVSEAVADDLAMCEAAVTDGKMHSRVKIDIYTPSAFEGTTKAFDTLPDLVKRFIATSSGGAPAGLVFHILQDEGGIWVVTRSNQSSCDILVTGFDKPSVEAEQLSVFSDAAGWQAVVQRPATATMPLGRYIFVKMLPNDQSAAFGIRARVQTLGTKASTSEGVQMDINLLAGAISRPAQPGSPPAKP